MAVRKRSHSDRGTLLLTTLPRPPAARHLASPLSPPLDIRRCPTTNDHPHAAWRLTSRHTLPSLFCSPLPVTQLTKLTGPSPPLLVHHFLVHRSPPAAPLRRPSLSRVALHHRAAAFAPSKYSRAGTKDRPATLCRSDSVAVEPWRCFDSTPLQSHLTCIALAGDCRRV